MKWRLERKNKLSLHQPDYAWTKVLLKVKVIITIFKTNHAIVSFVFFLLWEGLGYILYFLGFSNIWVRRPRISGSIVLQMCYYYSCSVTCCFLGWFSRVGVGGTVCAGTPLNVLWLLSIDFLFSTMIQLCWIMKNLVTVKAVSQMPVVALQLLDYVL